MKIIHNFPLSQKFRLIKVKKVKIVKKKYFQNRIEFFKIGELCKKTLNTHEGILNVKFFGILDFPIKKAFLKNQLVN